MTRRLVLRARVRGDIARAARWYEREREGLGAGYVAAIERTLDAVRDMPGRFPEVHGRIRRALAARFPYAVFFVIESDRVVVLAVLHQAADPASWPGG